jgi:hypothetical protein
MTKGLNKASYERLAKVAQEQTQEINGGIVESLDALMTEFETFLDSGEVTNPNSKAQAYRNMVNTRGFLRRIPESSYYREGPNGVIDRPSDEEIKNVYENLKIDLRVLKETSQKSR